MKTPLSTAAFSQSRMQHFVVEHELHYILRHQWMVQSGVDDDGAPGGIPIAQRPQQTMSVPTQLSDFQPTREIALIEAAVKGGQVVAATPWRARTLP